MRRQRSTGVSADLLACLTLLGYVLLVGGVAAWLGAGAACAAAGVSLVLLAKRG